MVGVRRVLVLMVVALSCGGDDGGASSAGQTSEADTSSASASTATTASTTATTNATATGQTTSSPATTSTDGGGESSGGVACESSSDCSAGQYCDWASDSCGVAGDGGVCRDAPIDCGADARPVCACNDQLYASLCEATAAGQDVAFLGQCDDPSGGFRCGYSYCVLGDEYCVENGGLMPTFECVGLPPVCQPPDCSCISTCCGCEDSACCSNYCSLDGEALKYVCPGP